MTSQASLLAARSSPRFMNRLDLTMLTPEANLACDEALLDMAEAGEVGEVLRFWEPQKHFVVVGYANKVVTEVNVSACERRGVPILRRCSGGGTVLQGPGCLNYSLILKVEGNAPLDSIAAANRFIMERNRAAIESELVRERNAFLLKRGWLSGANQTSESPLTRPADTLSPSAEGQGEGARFLMPGVSEPTETQVRIQGHTDLTLGGLKFSGNSQRRRRHFLLFHGTFLLNFDFALVEALLQLPSKQPDYRQHRKHRDFLVNLNVPATTVKAALATAWCATTTMAEVPETRIETLIREKYSARAWTMKF